MRIFLPKKWHALNHRFPIIIDVREKENSKTSKIFNKKVFEVFSDYFNKQLEVPWIAIEIHDLSYYKLKSLLSQIEDYAGESIAHIYVTRKNVTKNEIISILEHQELEKREEKSIIGIINKKYSEFKYLRIFNFIKRKTA